MDPQESHKSEVDAELQEKIKEIVRSNGITHCVSQVLINAGVQGQGFCSMTKCVTVIFEDGDVKPLNLFVKLRTQNSSHNQLMEEMRGFENEAIFFMEYVPAAEEMCRECGREGFIDFYPKCYFGDERITVLENVVMDKGFEVLEVEERQDFETARFALETLAKHHAVGHCMIQRCGGAAEFFEKFAGLEHEWCSRDHSFVSGLMGEFLSNGINLNVKILERSKIPGSESTAEKLKSFMGKPWDMMLDAIDQKDEDSFFLLCHGDYWNNNMMFLKDKGTNRIISHLAIDLQLTRYNSLAIDLSFYLFTTVQPTVRQNRLQELLELYRRKLNETSQEFGYPANLTFDRLFLELRKKLSYGFWMGFVMSVGPGMAIFRNTDVSQVDVQDQVAVTAKLVEKWVAGNPDKAMQVAEELVTLFQEYEELTLEPTK